MKKASETEELRRLDDIRRLLMLQLLRDGATSAEIGKALGVDGSTVRHLIGPQPRRPPGKDSR